MEQLFKFPCILHQNVFLFCAAGHDAHCLEKISMQVNAVDVMNFNPFKLTEIAF